MSEFIPYLLLMVILLVAQMFQKWSMALLLVIPAMIVWDGDDTFILVSICAVTYLVITDAKRKKDDSVFLKYNPFCDACKIPKSVRLILLVLGVVLSLIKMLMIMFHR